MKSAIVGFVLVLVLAAGCATLSPIPPQKAVTKALTAAACEKFDQQDRQYWVCLATAERIEREAAQKEIAELKAPKRPAAPPPMAFDDSSTGPGEEIPQKITGYPTTIMQNVGDGVQIVDVSWYPQVGPKDPEAVGCVFLNGVPMPIDPRPDPITGVVAPATEALIDHGSGRVESMPYRCATAKMSVWYKNLGPNDVVSVMYGHRASDTCLPRQTLGGRKCVPVYRETKTYVYRWNGFPGFTRIMAYDGSPG